MEPRISIITLGVTDLRRAVQFYQKGLGWPRSSAGDDEIAFFRTRGAVLALFPREDLAADANLPPGRGNTGFPGFTIAHNVASKGEVDSVLAKARSAGATILKAAVEVAWGGYSGYFADADGFLWEVAWNPHFPMNEDGSLRLPE